MPPGHRLASLGSPPLRHVQIRKSTHIPEACLASYVPPAGFGHPLGGFLLPDPLDHISGPSAHGVIPFRVFLPAEEPCFSRSLIALLSLAWHRLRRTDVTRNFRALLPPPEPRSQTTRLTPSGAVPLLGFSSWRLSPPRPCYPFGSTPLSHFTTAADRSRRRTLCLRVFLTRGRMGLLETSCLLDVFRLARFPFHSSPRRSLVDFFHLVDRRSLLNVA